MDKLIKKLLSLSNKKIVKNIMVLLSGTVAAQMIVFITMPLITRLFEPSAIGLLGTFTAVIEILIPIAALTYPIAIVLPRTENKALKVAKLSMVISIVISLCSIITILAFIYFNLFDQINLYIYLLLIPIVIISAGWLQVIEQWMIRNKEFKMIAKGSVMHSILVNGGKVGLGLINPIAIGLITITAVNQFVKGFIMHVFSTKKLKINFKLNKNDIYELFQVAKIYKDFPIYRAPQMLINAASQSLPVLLLLNFFGPASVGYYTIARTSLNAPIQLLGKVVGDVFYPRFTEASHNNESLYKLLLKATSMLFIVGIIPFSLIFLFGPLIFSVIFGAEWTIAGEYARWLSVWLFFLFVNNPSVRALPVLGAQKFHLVFTCVSLVLRFSSIFISYYIVNSDIIAIASFSIAGAILNIFLVLFTLKIAKK